MQESVVDILKKVGAIIADSHFVGTSGRHLKDYINKDLLYLHPVEAAKIGKIFAGKFKNKKIDMVVAPAIGGTILSQWTAYYLSKLKKREVLSTYTEKDKGTTSSASESNQIFRRGYDKYIKGKKVLVLEDLTTTGISVKKVVEVVRKAGGEVVGVCVMVNRDPKLVNEKTIGAPFSSLDVYVTESYEEKDCLLCKNNVPINTSVGHGKQFLADKAKKS